MFAFVQFNCRWVNRNGRHRNIGILDGYLNRVGSETAALLLHNSARDLVVPFLCEYSRGGCALYYLALNRPNYAILFFVNRLYCQYDFLVQCIFSFLNLDLRTNRMTYGVTYRCEVAHAAVRNVDRPHEIRACLARHERIGVLSNWVAFALVPVNLVVLRLGNECLCLRIVTDLLFVDVQLGSSHIYDVYRQCNLLTLVISASNLRYIVDSLSYCLRIDYRCGDERVARSVVPFQAGCVTCLANIFVERRHIFGSGCLAITQCYRFCSQHRNIHLRCLF